MPEVTEGTRLGYGEKGQLQALAQATGTSLQARNPSGSAPSPVGSPSAPAPSLGGDPLEFLQKTKLPQLNPNQPMTSGMEAGPGPGPAPSPDDVESLSEIDKLLLIARNARTPQLRAAAAAAARALIAQRAARRGRR